MLFPGIDAAVLAKYQARFHVQIPLTYAKVLAEMNGANLFELRLFGLPPSLLQDPPLIDRSVIQPLDLATANHSWKTKYGPPAGDFFVGSGPDGDQDRFGYFLSQEGSVASYGLGGKRVAHWPSFSEFLASELQRAEHRFPGFEQMHVALREQRHP
jgi:hypothetical protein